MKRVIISAVVMAMATASLAFPTSYRSSLMDEWIAVTFERQSVGEPLSDAGASGGSWGVQAIPDGVIAKVDTVSGVKCLGFDTSETSTNLSFTAEGVCPRKDMVISNFKMCFTEADSPVELGARTKAGLTMVRSSEGVTSFMGYGAGGWFPIAAEGVPADFDTWYDGQVRFRIYGGRLQVSYWIKESGKCQALKNEAGDIWLAAGGDGTDWRRVGLKGTGSLKELDGVYPGQGLVMGVKASE